MESRFNAELHLDSYRPRYNIAPGGTLAVVTAEERDAIVGHRWGLRPSWMDTHDEGFINARSETVAEKPSFRDAWAKRPCLVLSSGFYEWQERRGGTKQPYRVHRPGDPAFAFGGVWEPAPEGDDVRGTVTILTTAPNDLLRPIHDRMPVILPRASEGRWLEGDPEQRAPLCRPYPADDLTAYPISRRVNDPGTDDPQIIDPIDEPQFDLGDFA